MQDTVLGAGVEINKTEIPIQGSQAVPTDLRKCPIPCKGFWKWSSLTRDLRISKSLAVSGEGSQRK